MFTPFLAGGVGGGEACSIWLQQPYPIGQEPRRQEALFEASNINGVIECIDFIITFPSIWAPTEMYSLNNWKCIHEQFFISMVGECNCIAPLFQCYLRFYQETRVRACVCSCDKCEDSENMKKHEIVCVRVCVLCLKLNILSLNGWALNIEH